jgi:hypothetical protein
MKRILLFLLISLFTSGCYEMVQCSKVTSLAGAIFIRCDEISGGYLTPAACEAARERIKKEIPDLTTFCGY